MNSITEVTTRFFHAKGAKIFKIAGQGSLVLCGIDGWGTEKAAKPLFLGKKLATCALWFGMAANLENLRGLCVKPNYSDSCHSPKLACNP